MHEKLEFVTVRILARIYGVKIQISAALNVSGYLIVKFWMGQEKFINLMLRLNIPLIMQLFALADKLSYLVEPVVEPAKIFLGWVIAFSKFNLSLASRPNNPFNRLECFA